MTETFERIDSLGRPDGRYVALVNGRQQVEFYRDRSGVNTRTVVEILYTPDTEGVLGLKYISAIDGSVLVHTSYVRRLPPPLLDL